MVSSTLAVYMIRSDVTIAATSQYYNTSYDAYVSLGTTYGHVPYYANFLNLEISYTANYGLTQMPIPTQNTPFLLNFTGPNLAFQLAWNSITQSDVAFILEYFATANPSAQIVLDLTENWGATSSTNNIVTEKYNLGNTLLGTGFMRFVGIIGEISIKEKAGQILWDYSATLTVGMVVG